MREARWQSPWQDAARLLAVTAVTTVTAGQGPAAPRRVAGTHRSAALSEHALVGVVEELLLQLQHDLRATGPWAWGGADTGSSHMGPCPAHVPTRLPCVPAPCRVSPPPAACPWRVSPPPAACPCRASPPRAVLTLRSLSDSRKISFTTSLVSAARTVCIVAFVQSVWGKAGGTQLREGPRRPSPHPSALPAEGVRAGPGGGGHIRAHGLQADP